MKNNKNTVTRFEIILILAALLLIPETAYAHGLPLAFVGILFIGPIIFFVFLGLIAFSNKYEGKRIKCLLAVTIPAAIGIGIIVYLNNNTSLVFIPIFTAIIPFISLLIARHDPNE